MARMNLSGWTPEAIKARKHEQADARKKKQRRKDKEVREMAKKKVLLTPASPDVVEFMKLIEGLKLRALVEAVAAWERDYKQPFPLAPLPENVSPFGEEGMRHRDLGLAKILAHDFYGREKAADRKKAFDARDAAEANRLGITVFELRKRRKIALAADARKARAVERLARKQAA